MCTAPSTVTYTSIRRRSLFSSLNPGPDPPACTSEKVRVGTSPSIQFRLLLHFRRGIMRTELYFEQTILPTLPNLYHQCCCYRDAILAVFDCGQRDFATTTKPSSPMLLSERVNTRSARLWTSGEANTISPSSPILL
jgi:hypothetical protein